MTAKDGCVKALADDLLMCKKKDTKNKDVWEEEDESAELQTQLASSKKYQGDLALTLLPISKPGLQNCLKYSQFLVFQASRRVANLSGHLETQSCGRQHVLLMRAPINHA